MEGEARLQRGRLVYRGGDSSTEGETRLQRGRGCVLLDDVIAISSYLSASSDTIFSYLFWKCSSPAPGWTCRGPW
jgi:hypothetical protein